jgi:signal transduction histidine kinase
LINSATAKPKEYNKRLSFFYFFKEGLLETFFFCQILGLLASVILLVYGDFKSSENIIPISFIFANFFGLFIKFLGALAYRWFYTPLSNNKLIHIGIWAPCLLLGTFIGTEAAMGINALAFDMWHPPFFSGDHFALLTANMMMALIFFSLTVVYVQKKKRLKQKIIENQRIQHLQTKSKLMALQSKINPHFLFNTLNTMLSLVRKSPERVETMILNLSDIYRKMLQYPEDQKISLKEEIKLVKEYLEIEKIRLGKRLQFFLSIDKGIGEAKIPPLLIEPVVENAVIHGISPKPDGGEINIQVRKNKKGLEITVSDNGIGIGKGNQKAGFGLSSVKERIHLIYGEKAGFEMTDLPEGGVRITMEIPYEN